MRQFFIFFLCYLICASCNNSDQLVNQDKQSLKDLMNIKEQVTKVEVGYYVDLKKTPITKIYLPEEARLDYVDFIKKSKTQNTCTLDLIDNIPDGHIEVLNDSKTLLHLEFILKGKCKGFYSDFSNKPKKYDISSEGIIELTKLMKRTKI